MTTCGVPPSSILEDGAPEVKSVPFMQKYREFFKACCFGQVNIVIIEYSIIVSGMMGSLVGKFYINTKSVTLKDVTHLA